MKREQHEERHKCENSIKCVRIQKHFGVRQYKAEAGSGKKWRKEPECGRPI